MTLFTINLYLVVVSSTNCTRIIIKNRYIQLVAILNIYEHVIILQKPFHDKVA